MDAVTLRACYARISAFGYDVLAAFDCCFCKMLGELLEKRPLGLFSRVYKRLMRCVLNKYVVLVRNPGCITQTGFVKI